MRFNPVRFEELLSFAGTLCCAWVMSSLLIGGYRTHATSGAKLGDLFFFVNLCASSHSPACWPHCYQCACMLRYIEYCGCLGQCLGIITSCAPCSLRPTCCGRPKDSAGARGGRLADRHASGRLPAGARHGVRRAHARGRFAVRARPAAGSLRSAFAWLPSLHRALWSPGLCGSACWSVALPLRTGWCRQPRVRQHTAAVCNGILQACVKPVEGMGYVLINCAAFCACDDAGSLGFCTHRIYGPKVYAGIVASLRMFKSAVC